MNNIAKDNTEAYNPLEKDLLEAANAMLAHVQGKADYPTRHYPVTAEQDVREIRQQLQLTQQQFANYIGASVHAVRHWENGRRRPQGTARTLLHILQENPEAVMDVLGKPR